MLQLKAVTHNQGLLFDRLIELRQPAMTQARAYIGAGACCLIGAALLVYSSVTFALRTPGTHRRLAV